MKRENLKTFLILFFGGIFIGYLGISFIFWDFEFYNLIADIGKNLRFVILMAILLYISLCIRITML